MSEFNNVTVVKAANVYFDGKVSSRTVKFADGSRLSYTCTGTESIDHYYSDSVCRWRQHGAKVLYA